MTKSVEVKLGSVRDMAELFAHGVNPEVRLPDWIGHGFNQTLLRDGFHGAWADVFYYDDCQELGVKISSPEDDVSAYAAAIPAFLAAAKLALETWRDNLGRISSEHLFFFLPLGLPLANGRSVQLLHYPPYESRTYMDYLYSPTNRRWESLLAYNGLRGAEAALYERIVDLVPLAGPGSDARGIDRFNEAFTPYVKTMLRAVLDTSGAATQPVVAYGGPVRTWLRHAFPDQVARTPHAMDLATLTLGDGAARTPVLCANHPSEFLFFRKHESDPAWATGVTTDDLVAARWQLHMAERRDADPAVVLEEARAYWRGRPDDVARIVAEQKTEFGFAHTLRS